MPYIKRKIEDAFLKYSSEYQVMLLTGQRQSGKTTMLKNLINDKKYSREYFSLDTQIARLAAINDTENFFKIHKPPILIDEAQNTPTIFDYIKSIVDKRKKPGDFWLTGSHIFKMMDNIQESLTGRVCILKMTTLSLSEIYNFRSNEFLVNDNILIDKYNERKVFDNSNLYNDILLGSMPTALIAFSFIIHYCANNSIVIR